LCPLVFKEKDVGIRRSGQDSVDPDQRNSNVILIPLHADPMAMQFFRDRTRRATAEEWVEHHIAGIGTGKDDAVQQRFGFLRRVRLCAVDIALFYSLFNFSSPRFQL
jgi:hypothetical protein